MKALNGQIRDEKQRIERALVEAEFLVQEKEAELAAVKEKNLKERALADEKLAELVDKVDWFRENQRLLTDQAEEVRSQGTLLRDLRT